MTLNDACEHIRETANAYGFEVEQSQLFRLPVIRSEELNFCLLEKHDYNREERTVTTRVLPSASVRRMGGSPTVEELLKTAEAIRRCADLAPPFQPIEPSLTDTL